MKRKILIILLMAAASAVGLTLTSDTAGDILCKISTSLCEEK